MKTCNHCKKEKSYNNFYAIGKNKNGSIKYKSRCKECLTTLALEKYHSLDIKDKKERYNKQKARYTKEEWHEIKLRTRYNISVPEYEKMKTEQDCKCKICNTQLQFGSAHNPKNNARIDHCHESGLVRGLLCHKCNSILGFANDNPNILKNAINYLNESNG